MNELVTIASYNIHSCIGTDGRRDPGRIAQVIREIDPDIIGLQEVDGGFWSKEEENQLDILTRESGLDSVSGPTLISDHGQYGNGLLTKWPIQNVRRLDLSVPDREPRGALDVEVAVGNKTFRVLVAHFGLSASERFTQAGALLGLLKDDCSDIQIIAGDFNEWAPRRRTIQMLNDRFGKSRAIRTWPARMPIFALDRIWLSPEQVLWKYYSHHSKTAKQASDHLPIVAQVCFGPLGT